MDLSANKYQIIISTLLGLVYYLWTKNESRAVVLTLLLAVILRAINIDRYILDMRINSLLKLKATEDKQ